MAIVIPDTNILLYAYFAESPHHREAAAWLKELFNGTEAVGLAWQVLWGFLRIGTNPRVWNVPMPAGLACDLLREWLALPGVAPIEPGPRHQDLLKDLMERYGARGPLVSDAALAAIAIEHGATLASTDRDFSRFSGLRWIHPLER